MRFVIERDGRVSNTAVLYNDLPDCSVVRCIRRMFTELQFPKPEGGVVKVQYPIMLEPAEE